MKMKHISVLLLTFTLLTLSGCGAVEDLLNKAGNMVKDEVGKEQEPVAPIEEPDSSDVEDVNASPNDAVNDTQDGSMTLATNNPLRLSKDLIEQLNAFHMLAANDPSEFPREALDELLPMFVDLENESLPESDLIALIDKSYAQIGKAPVDFPIEPLAHSVFINSKFIPVDFDYSGEFNSWAGSFHFKQSADEVFNHYRETLLKAGFELLGEGEGLTNESSLSEAYLSFEGDIDGKLYEVHLTINDFFTDPLDEGTRSFISITEKR